MSADQPAFVRQHRVQGKIVMPATAYLGTLLAAGRDVLGSNAVAVDDITVQEAMVLDDDGAGRTVQLVCGAERDGVIAATLSSIADDAGEEAAWTRHVTASLRAGDRAADAGSSLADARSRCVEPMAAGDFYAGFEARGLDFGSGFRSIQRVWRGESQALGEVALAPELATDAPVYGVHPVLLDGCLQLLAAAVPSAGDDDLFLPIGVGRYAQHGAAGARCWAHVTLRESGAEARRADLRVFGDDGSLVAELRDIRLKRVSRDALERLGERWLDECLYEVAWRVLPGSGEVGGGEAVAAAAFAAAESAPIGALRAAAGLDAYDPMLPRLESVCG